MWRGTMHLVVIAALAAAPYLAGDYALLLMTKILALALFAMSLDLLVGQAGMVSFGHAAFFGAGAYGAAMLAPDFAPANLLVSLPLSALAAGLLALAIGAACLRVRGVYFIMATLAFAQMAYFFIHDTPWFGGSDGLLIFARPEAMVGGILLFDLEDGAGYYWFTLGVVLAGYWLLARMALSPFGHVLKGIHANESRMRSLGYSTWAYRLVAFVIAGMLAGVAGWLVAYQAEYVSPALLSWQESGLVLMMVILGGAGTIWGAAVGALALVLLQEILADITPHWMLFMGLLLMAAVVLLPRGLAGIMKKAASRHG